VVLGSALSAAFAPEAVAIANRFIPALSAALADGGSLHVEARPQSRVTATPDPASANGEIAFEYFESMASTTELVSVCGVIATQITNRTSASRVQIGFIDEETGRSELGFDTESSDDALDNAWISPDQIESLLELESADASLVHPKYLSMRTAIKSSDRVVGYVEAERVESGFDYDDIVQIKEIIAACAPVVATLKQLERSQATLGKLEMLRRDPFK
jgi:hypothetical protein